MWTIILIFGWVWWVMNMKFQNAYDPWFYSELEEWFKTYKLTHKKLDLQDLYKYFLWMTLYHNYNYILFGIISFEFLCFFYLLIF